MKEKLKTQKKIEKYREDKIQRELEMLDHIRKNERMEKEKSRNENDKRNKYILQQRKRLVDYHHQKDINKVEELKREEKEFENDKIKQYKNRRRLEQIRDYNIRKKQAEELFKMNPSPHNLWKLVFCNQTRRS